MTPFSRTRRFAVAGAALGIAAILMRSQIAEALTVRGDEYLYSAKPAAALERYRRALAITPDTESAADRFTFVSMEQHSIPALHAGIAVAGRYLSRHPKDALLLSDRALCFLIERRYAKAQDDFEQAARIDKDSQMFVFAGWSAWHRGLHVTARSLWRDALQIDPRDGAAVLALRRSANG